MRKALQDEAATHTKEKTACGKTKAVGEATKAFDTKATGGAINKVLKDWQEKEGKAQKDYDDETTHGLVEDKQTEWKGKIADGLKDYEVQ
jgi:hypothetical protein